MTQFDRMRKNLVWHLSAFKNTDFRFLNISLLTHYIKMLIQNDEMQKTSIKYPFLKIKNPKLLYGIWDL
ncbi:hypothetical protein BSF42_29410 [Flavobacterium sp. ACN6]|nr:hypothetical protein BSF42_29410 [Flavobacterium sp. ACN6]